MQYQNCFRKVFSTYKEFSLARERGAASQVGAAMKDKNLCLIKQRYQAINTDSRVLIYERENLSGAMAPGPPFAAIPVKERKSDREACLLAMAWLREHRHLTTAEYLREVEKFLLNEAGHPTKAVDSDRLPHRGSGKIGRDERTTTIREDGQLP